jgi:hypothetical protein
MNSTTSTSHQNVNVNARKRRKKSGWTPIGIAAMVLGFMVSWPIGLAVIAYMMWGGRVDDLIKDTVDLVKGAVRPAPATSGNAAFDEYKAATLRDLEEQQAEFAEYVDHLRQARDREEFEHYMKSKKK